MPGNKKLFLSAVSSEFISYRNLLAGDLKRPNLDVAVQEDFVVTGGSTLEKLDTYIVHCDAVIHLVGKVTGGVPEEPAVAALLARYPDFGTRLPPLAEHLRKPQPSFSYTQWEAYLALYHGRPLFVYRPTDFELDALEVPRAARFVFNPAACPHPESPRHLPARRPQRIEGHLKHERTALLESTKSKEEPMP